MRENNNMEKQPIDDNNGNFEFSDWKENVENDKTYSGWSLKYAVEVPIVLILFASTLGHVAVNNVILYRTCVHSLNYSSAECHSFLEPNAINHSQELEEEVQLHSMEVTMVRSVIDALGPAVLSLFMGAWADKHGRKPLLDWPMIGMAVSALLMMIYTKVAALGPWWTIVTVIPTSLTGGIMVMATGAMCTISDVTPKENRSLKLMIIHAMISLGTAAGSMASSYVLKAVGTVYLLVIQTALLIIGTLFNLIFIKESMRNPKKGSILTIFNFSHAKDIYYACFTRKPHYGRAIILLTVLASSLQIFTVYGSSGLAYMYTRTKIQWSSQDYTTYAAVTKAITFLGSIIGVGFVQKALRISDLNFSIGAYLTCILENITKAMATTTWHMYLGSAIALLGSVPEPLIRSFLTKFVAEDDMAKVFGLMGSADSISPLVSPLIYSALYSATISTFPGAIMILTAFVFGICLGLLLLVQFLRKKAPSTPAPA